MTVKELLECTVCDVGLSFCEDPTGKAPELLFQFRNGERDEKDVLSDSLLNSNIHLIDSYHGIIHATVWAD